MLTLDPVVSLELAAETIWKVHPMTLPDLLYGPQSTWLHEIEPNGFEKHYVSRFNGTLSLHILVRVHISETITGNTTPELINKTALGAW